MTVDRDRVVALLVQVTLDTHKSAAIEFAEHRCKQAKDNGYVYETWARVLQGLHEINDSTRIKLNGSW